ncbi:MAG: hypothetical protein AAF770_01790 [Bacteroidota bacterium]
MHNQWLLPLILLLFGLHRLSINPYTNKDHHTTKVEKSKKRKMTVA